MRRGQEEQPIELLLSVFILSFVIAIAGVTISASQCQSQELALRKSIRSMATVLQQVFAAGPATRMTTAIDFGVSGCEKISGVSMKLFRTSRSSPEICAECSGREQCYYIEASRLETDPLTGRQSKYTFLIECVDIPSTADLYVVGIDWLDPDSCTIETALARQDQRSTFEFSPGTHTIMFQKDVYENILICDQLTLSQLHDVYGLDVGSSESGAASFELSVSVSPNPATAGLPVSFDVILSYNANKAGCFMLFGDGEMAECEDEECKRFHTEHTYAEPGPYYFDIACDDTAGNSELEDVLITVN